VSLPAQPKANAIILRDGLKLQRTLDPNSTDMEGGNVRERPRPGNNGGTITARPSPASPRLSPQGCGFGRVLAPQ
jgi:hypothetical protein